MNCESILKSKWDPYFYQKFLGFKNSLPLLEKNNFPQWPSIQDYNHLASKQVNFSECARVSFLLQNASMQYENEIFQNRTVPTRLYHWHDFFNNLTWMTFPKTKWAIIQRTHYEKQNAVSKKRTDRQNLLAHFDECGLVLCSDNSEFFDIFQSFAWKKGFWELKAKLLHHCYPIVFGHGILEKALTPYIGLTAKAIFLQTPSSFLNLSPEQKIVLVDATLSEYILSQDFPIKPKALTPFPLLGWPDWHKENKVEVFYDNTNYFRTKPPNSSDFVARTSLSAPLVLGDAK